MLVHDKATWVQGQVKFSARRLRFGSGRANSGARRVVVCATRVRVR